jgi:predicted lipoprotein with Yx(FWY)xxD motif
MPRRAGIVGGFLAGLILPQAATFAAAPAAPDPPRPSVVTLRKISEGFAFGNEKGMALYTFDDDLKTPGASTCTFDKSCAWRWPPFYAADGAVPAGEWTIIKRPDQSRQWAYKGKPVYTYRDDLSPGVLSGDNGQAGKFHALVIVTPTPTPAMPAGFKVIRHDDAWVYVDYDGRALYTADAGKTGKFSCDTKCSHNWTPVSAAALALSVDGWVPVVHADGSRQWTLDGAALYTKADMESDDASTERWHVMKVAE